LVCRGRGRLFRRDRRRKVAGPQPRRGHALRQRHVALARIEPSGRRSPGDRAHAALTRAFVLVAPRGSGGETRVAESRVAENGVPPETPLLGLPLIRRTVLAARRAGFTSVSVAGATPGIRAALEGAAV